MTQDERHWDYTCLTILTIETAALAAAFLIPGTGTGKVNGQRGLRGRSPQGSRHPDCSRYAPRG